MGIENSLFYKMTTLRDSAMFSFLNGTKWVPATLPLAVVFSLVLSLVSAYGQPSALPGQSAGAPLEEPDEQGNGDPAEPLQATENSPPESRELHRVAAAGAVESLLANGSAETRSRLHRAAGIGDVESVKRLIGENPDGINSKDSPGGLTPLHEAARAGHGDVAQVLIAAGADPNDTTTHGNQTPLHLAAKIGAEEVCKILLEAGAGLWFEDEDDTTAMEVAIQEGNVELVKLFADANVKWLSRPKPYRFYADLRSPPLGTLHLAASNNNTEIMKVLLENRKIWLREVNKKSGWLIEEDMLDKGDRFINNTALHLASYNGHTEIAKLLVQAGAYVMTENGDHKTPIDLAYEQGHVNLAQMLERTPELLGAVTAGDVGTVEQLIDEEQSVNVKHPFDGYTPLHEAARMGHTDVIQVLLDAGADIYLQDKNNATALDIAIEKGYVEIAKTLKDADGLINKDNKSSLKSAVSNGNTEMVKIITEYLIENARKKERSIYPSINYNIDNYDHYAAIDNITHGTSLLHVAAANGYTEIAKLLVQAGAYVMAQNNDSKTPIDLAYEQGHVSLAQMLEKTLKLHEAAVTGDAEKVKELLAAGVLTDAQDSVGATVLYRVIEGYVESLDSFDIEETLYPVAEGHMDVVRALIEAGAKVDSFTRWEGTSRGFMHRSLNFSNATPLHVAAMAGRPEIVRLLIEAGKDINGYLDFRNHRNYHNALSLGLEENPNQEVAKLLIQAGAEVNAVNGLEETPLHTVATMHEDVTMSINIATALINAGANLNSKTSRLSSFSFRVGYTPLHTAASVNHIEMVKLLIKHGANINSKDEADNSPLHLAIYNGHGKLAKLLIESGAYIHSRNYNDNLPIQMAAYAGLPEVIQQLIEAGSPINAQDQVGDTPLHDAALQGQEEAAQVLLEAGADVNATNNAGKTPLDLAERQGHDSLTEILKAAGGQQGI